MEYVDDTLTHTQPVMRLYAVPMHAFTGDDEDGGEDLDFEEPEP
jgi:hypothetical protein